MWFGKEISLADAVANLQSRVTNAGPYSQPRNPLDSWWESDTYAGDQKYLEAEAQIPRDNWTAEKVVCGMKQPKVQLQKLQKAKLTEFGLWH